MKKNKISLLTILGMFSFTLFISSCKDEFSEEDLLLHQEEKAQQQAEENAVALGAASLLDYAVTVHSDDNPIEGVTVTLTNQNDGTTVSATTDARGTASFMDIEMGGHLVSISSSDHLDVSYLVDFGKPIEGVHYQMINGSVIPLETSEASKIELYELNGMQTATIKGRVEIETDLTNKTAEVPQDITIRANMDANFNASHTNIDGAGTSIYVNGSFTFTEGNIGMAVVDNQTGEYSMMVPANEDGTLVEFIYPLVEADQTLAWTKVNGQDVGVQVGTQPALFGPDIDLEAPPVVPGAVAVFPEPPAPGRGFTLDFERVYFTFPHEALIVDDFPNEMDNPYERFIGNPGSDDHQLPPSVTVSAPDDPIAALNPLSTPRAFAEMLWHFQSVEILAAGIYSANADVFLQVEFWSEGVNYDTQYVSLGNAGATGIFPPEGIMDLDATLNDLVVENNQLLVDEIKFSIISPQPTILPASFGNVEYGGTVDGFIFPTIGNGYNNIPTITVGNEGNASTPASLEVSEMAFYYFAHLDNSNVTQGYVVLPQISYEYESAPGSILTGTQMHAVELDNNGYIFNTQTYSALEDILGVSNGNLVYNQNDQFLTLNSIDATIIPNYSFSEPKAIVVEPNHEQAVANVTVDNNGEVTGIDPIVFGHGYNAPFDISIEGLGGGSGAEVDLTSFITNEPTGEVLWFGFSQVVSGGSGYVGEANINAEVFTGATTVIVKNGETKINNVNYGTGDPIADLD